MGYLHIDNLYKDQTILMLKECFALEKVHGTSAHLKWKDGRVTYFSGGESHPKFLAIFDVDRMHASLAAVGQSEVTVYGEAYGGKCMGMRMTYGEELRFIAFDVRIGEHWLSVPQAVQIVESLGLEFVPWEKTSTDVAILDRIRDRPSEVAVRRGRGAHAREGIVLRPLIELTTNAGSRIIAKHKGATFSERITPPKIMDPAQLAILVAADAIAEEWVTEMRLTHVLDKVRAANGGDVGIQHTPRVIDAMVEDVTREAAGEIVESKDADRAIRKRAASMFKARLQARLGDVP